jgi:hypothetical protein
MGVFLQYQLINLVLQAKVRIPAQSCHLIQTKAATHSISKLPPIPVKSATPLKFKF